MGLFNHSTIFLGYLLYSNPYLMLLRFYSCLLYTSPLFNSRNMKYILKNRDDFIISPSKGGGTNLLYINREYNYKPLFGAFSFFKHVQEAKNNNLDVNIYDSFYLSLDVNTPEDLGEILLHGRNTHTYNYLSNLNIGVESNHGKERLYVYRKNE